MKKALFLSVLLLALVATLHAQAPRSINSQAVLRDAAGRLIANQSVGVRIIIAQGFPTGTVAYEETHIATTNENGLYTITIGAGTPATGSFATIDWGNGPYFITTDIDPAGGTNYIITTSQQFLSVPYALLADTAVRVARATTAANAAHATNADHSTLSDNATNALYADTARYYRERQVLTRSNDTIYLTGGSYVVLPPSSNANINNNYIDSVIHANNSTVVNRYVDSVVNARNTTVVNNIQNQISDSVRRMQTMLRDSIIIRHSDSSHTAIYSDTARYYQERQVLSIGHDTIYLSGGSYVVLPPSGNVNINNHYIDSVIRANNSTVVNRYVDSVVRANNTTVVNNIQNQISDSVRQMHTTINNTITTQMRDSIISIIRDSANTIQQSISTPSAGTCYASCGSVDSLRRRQDSVRRAFDSVVGVQDITLRRYDSIINVQRRDIRRYDSIIRTYDSVIDNYDSVVNVLVHRVDSVVNAGTTDPSDPCSGRATLGTDMQTACDTYTWIDGRTYTASTTTATHILYGANAVGCDSIVTLNLTINRKTMGIDEQTATNSYTWINGITYYASTMVPTNTFANGNAKGCDSTVTLHLTITNGGVAVDGALPGVFSVSATKKVRFSQGNLQYNHSTRTWRFAQEQTSYIGDTYANKNGARSTQDEWMDLFGWGTNGHHNSADYYNQRYSPTSVGYSVIDEYYNKYGYGPSRGFESEWKNYLDYSNISNGGDAQWRLLSKNEWDYLLNTRNTSCVLRGTVTRYFITTNGLIILPDNYVHPAGTSIPNYPNGSISLDSRLETISETTWQRMEAAGAVLLPYAGYRRKGTYNTGCISGNGAILSVTNAGFYWTFDKNATALFVQGYNDSHYPYRPITKCATSDYSVCGYADGLGNKSVFSDENRSPLVDVYIGKSIRLVQDVQE